MLTAENLRGELLDLWSDKKLPTRAVFIVTHNIEEAVLLADRIVVLGKNPGKIRTDFRVSLPRPRDRKNPFFEQIVDHVYKVLTLPDQTPVMADFSVATKFQMLPHARPGGVSGLLEILADATGREDIYKLADELAFEIDDLLPTVEAAGMLGFVKVSEGDVEITDAGRTFVDSDVLLRKELFRKAAVEHAALIRQIVRALEKKANHKLNDEFFHDILDEHFTESETQLQLETAIVWGRFAELFDHDSNGKYFFMPEETAVASGESGIVKAVPKMPATIPATNVNSQQLWRTRLQQRSWPVLIDLAVFAALLAVIGALAAVARYWFSAAVPAAEISRSPRALPLYSFYSLVRMGTAYLLSLVFAVAYGYIATYSKRWRAVMLAILDYSLQSIPVLSFLPGVMLAMVALFPTRQMGVEFGSIILIFTGQVWNMAFSFYASMQAIPRELREASRVYRFSRLQTFLQLELPYGSIGLVWNSMVSVAGGWFFLMACEMFQLGKRDFRLPGLGSFLQSAASAGDTGAIIWGLLAMITVIVLIDQLIWRPAIAWSDKFKFEQVESNAAPASGILNLLSNT